MTGALPTRIGCELTAGCPRCSTPISTWMRRVRSWSLPHTSRHHLRYNIRVSSHSNQPNHSEPPLWSIAIAVVIILAAPVILNSLAPTGPIRERDTVFSDGEQRVTMLHAGADSSDTRDETCLLDPNTPLIVIRSVSESEDVLVAEVQGSAPPEWPFCRVHTEVRLTRHQVFQKPAALGGVRDTLTRWLSR